MDFNSASGASVGTLSSGGFKVDSALASSNFDDSQPSHSAIIALDLNPVPCRKAQQGGTDRRQYGYRSNGDVRLLGINKRHFSPRPAFGVIDKRRSNLDRTVRLIRKLCTA
jgi:hypothetical protein